MITRAALQHALVAALGDVPVHLGRSVFAMDQDGAGVRITDDAGGVFAADLAIDAGGIWSPIATRLLGNPPTYRGYGGVLAITEPMDEASDDIATEYWGKGERFGLLGLAEQRRYWFYLRDQAADAAMPDHAFLARRAGDWPGPIAAAIAGTPPDRLIPIAIHARPAPRRLGQGRILCVGDAAHAMEPNLGQGACQAIEDAVALGAAAGRASPAELLPVFQAMRLARVTRIARRAAEGGRAVHGPAPIQAAMRGVLALLPGPAQRALTQSIHRMPDY